MADIKGFRGERRFLSNFYQPAEVFGYRTVENAYQAGKCENKGLRGKFKNISPGEAKQLGRRTALREDWEEIKLGVMLSLLKEKFTKHPKLRELLLATGDEELVEWNTWHDNFWGICTCSKCASGIHQSENHLGKLLMQIRRDLS